MYAATGMISQITITDLKFSEAVMINNLKRIHNAR